MAFVSGTLTEAERYMLGLRHADRTPARARHDPAGSDGDSTDDRVFGPLLFEEIRDELEYAFEAQGSTGNPCFGTSLPVSSPATSRSAASV